LIINVIKRLLGSKEDVFLPPQNGTKMDIKLITITPDDFEQLKADLINTVREELAKSSVSGGSEDEYLTSKEVCEELGISSRQFQKYRDERRISFSQFGRKIYVKRSDLNEFIASHRIPSRYEVKP
jgi:excisionase family DNA binding protein